MPLLADRAQQNGETGWRRRNRARRNQRASQVRQGRGRGRDTFVGSRESRTRWSSDSRRSRRWSNAAQRRPSDGVRSRSRHVGRALPGGAPVPVRRSTPAASIHRTSPLLHEIGHGGEEPARHVRDVARALEDPVARRAVRRIAPLASSAVVHPTPADSWVDDDLGCSFPAATSALGRRVRLSLGPRLLDRRRISDTRST